MFASDDAKERFSMRNTVRKKGGTAIFIEYDLTVGEVMTPMYRLLIDLALKEALGRTEEKGNVYLILDELKLLPKLKHLDDALNFGRSIDHTFQLSKYSKCLIRCSVSDIRQQTPHIWII